MATNSLGELNILIRGDASGLQQAALNAGKSLQKVSQDLQAQGKDINNYNLGMVSLMKNWGTNAPQSIQKLTKDLALLKQALVDGGQATSVNQKGINKLTTDAIIAANAQKQLEKETKLQAQASKEQEKQITAASKAMDKQAKVDAKALTDQNKAIAQQQKDATKESQAFGNQIKTLSSSLWLATAGLKQFGMAMSTAFTLPIVAAGTAAIKTFTDWQQATLKIQGAAEITSEEANKITDGFIKISQQVPLTVKDLQDAGFAAAQAGVTGSEGITNFAKAAVMLAQVGGDALKGLPVKDLSNSLAKLSIAFGESGENMEKVNNTASMLLAVSKAVPGGLGEVVEALRRAAPMSSALGLSLADTTAVMGTLVAAALPASRAGTEFNTALSNMVKNSDAVAGALGVTTEGMGDFKKRMDTDLMGVLDDLIRRYGDVASRTDMAAKMTEIFGEVSKKSILALIQNYDLFKDLQARSNQEMESGTLLATQFALQSNSLSGTFTVLQSAVQSVAYAIGKDLAPYINLFAKNATQALINLATTWQSLNPTIKAAIVIFAGLIAILGPLALLLNTVFLNPIAGLITFISKIGVAIATMLGFTAAGEMGAMSNIILAFSAEGAAGGFAMLGTAVWAAMAPLLAIIGIIAGVVGALYLLGRVFGIGFKMPSMPKINMPTFGKTPAGKTEEEATQAALEESNKKKEAAAKKEQDALDRELRDKKKADEKLLKAKEDEVKAYEKIRDAELKIQQKLVDDQQDIIDAKKEGWEDEKRLADEQITAQEAVIKTIKKTLDAAKKELNALKDARDKEVDTAEGKIEIAKNSLEAAQEALKREVILGHDEYDLSYRIAEQRVKDAEAALQLAENNKIAVEKVWQDQIDAQEAIVTTTEDALTIQEDALDRLKTALEARATLVEKEIDLLDDELNIRQDSLDKIKTSTQEKLDLLNEERDLKKDELDQEEQLIQDKLDAMKDQVQAIKDMPVSELPDVAGKMQEMTDAIQKQITDISAQAQKDMSFGFTKKENNKPLENIADIGGDIVGLFIGDDKRKELETQASEAGTSIGGLYMDNLKTEWQSGWDTFKVDAQTGWDESVADWNGTITSLKTTWQTVWDDISKVSGDIFVSLFDALFGAGKWDEMNTQAETQGTTITSLIWDGIKQGWEDNVVAPFKQWLQDKIIQPITDIFSTLKTKGGEIIGNVAQGMWDSLSWIKDAARGIWDWFWGGFSSRLDDANQWGKDMIGKFAQGIWDGMGWVKDAVNNMAGWLKGILHFSEPDFGPLRGIASWGKDMVRTYGDSIKGEIPYLEDVINGLNVDLGQNLIGSNSALLSNSGQNATQQSTSTSTVNKNYYIQPGQMIASRGEVRNFVRMMKEYDQFEEGR